MFVGADAVGSSGIGAALGLAAIKIIALVALVVVLGKWVIPWAIEQIAAAHSRELFTLSVLVVALGIAIGAAKLFGVSMALGAFLAGLAVGRSEFAARAANDALPMRDAFAVLFFVSVGMLCDPYSVVRAPLLTAMVLGVVLVGKPLAALLVVRVLGKPMAVAIGVGAALSQVGEFSFILGAAAKRLGVISDDGWNARRSCRSRSTRPFTAPLGACLRALRSSVPRRSARQSIRGGASSSVSARSVAPCVASCSSTTPSSR
jgi:CPA2 family monovalent cation:H+ antiporter-2